MSKCGQINCKNGLIVTDPMYIETGKHNKIIKNAKKGIWDCYIFYDKNKISGEKINYVIIINSDIYDEDIEWETIGNPSEKSSDLICVDSAKLGFFNLENFKENNYKQEDIGQVKDGFICSSSCGNGYYPVLKKEKDGKVFALGVMFVSDIIK